MGSKSDAIGAVACGKIDQGKQAGLPGRAHAAMDIESIKHSTNIVNFIGRRVKLHKVGSIYQGLCPFHAERNPSFTVDPRRQKFKCFGCDASGDVFDFVMLFDNVDFKEAVRRVCEEQGLQHEQPFEAHFDPLPKHPRKASDAICDTVYKALLRNLGLSQEHRDHLRGRGLPDNEIDRRGYKTLPNDPRTRQETALKLYRAFGDEVFKVPGIVQRKTKNGREYVTIAGHAGLVIPVRNLQTQIVALKVRLSSEDANGGKYRWITSAQDGGPSAGNPCHVPLKDVDHAKGVIRVTEGELKADIATVLDPKRILTVSVPGVTAWRAVIPILYRLTPRKVVFAWDKDLQTNSFVLKTLVQAYNEIKQMGFEVGGETW